MTAQAVLKVAKKYIGVEQGSVLHKSIIDRYNQVLPRPVGYRVTYSDDWCDTFVTAVADEAGATKLIGRECGVQRHIAIFKQLGIWLGKTRPQKGDIITFDWDGGGFADHIGYVERVEGDWVYTIEGNANRRVAQQKFFWNDWRIMGYARPRYQVEVTAKSQVSKTDTDKIVQEVIRGKWGAGRERVQGLTAAGYDANKIQALVNQTLSQANKKPMRVIIPNTTTHWHTGQRIPSWLHGVSVEVSKEIIKEGQKLVLLSSKDVPLGWLEKSQVQGA